MPIKAPPRAAAPTRLARATVERIKDDDGEVDVFFKMAGKQHASDKNELEHEKSEKSSDDQFDDAEKWETVINKRRGKKGMDAEVVSILQALHERISKLELDI